MSGFLVLADGRAWSLATWAFDAALREIADALPDDPGAAPLATWLRDQQSDVVGLGMSYVDMRELTDDNRRRLIDAIPRAVDRARTHGGAHWHKPSFFPEWLTELEVLVRMVQAVERGDPPEALNPHMRELIPPTGNRSGPGWE